MANEQIKISELTEVTSVTGNEEMPVVQSGSTKKMSLNQAKDFIGGAGVIIFPEDILELKQDSTSDEIFTAFGGKTNYNNTISKIKTESLIKIGDGPLYSISLVVGASYTDEDNSQVVIQSLSLNVSFYLQVTVTNGTAKALVAKYTFVDAANVLQKNNTDAFTPTSDYQPATKKYVDDKVYVVNNSTWEEVLRNNKSINGTDVQALINKLFGNYSTYLSFLQGVNENVYNGLKFTDWMYDDVNGYGVGSSYTAGDLYAKHNTAEGEFNCNFTYFYKNALKCCIINVNEASNHNYDKLIIQDIVTSDNLNTITKKSTEEYVAITNKDANTVYCVTD